MRYEFFVQVEPPGAQSHTDLFEGLDIHNVAVTTKPTAREG
jgi:hypothetical protein